MSERLEIDDLLDRWEAFDGCGATLSPDAFWGRLTDEERSALTEEDREELSRRIEKLIAVNRRLAAILPERGSSHSTKSDPAGFVPDGNGIFASLTAGLEPVAGYRLIEWLGRGGFGEVWKSQAPGGFFVAMKFLPQGGSPVRLEKESFEVVREIRHPNLLPVFGVWETARFLVVATG